MEQRENKSQDAELLLDKNIQDSAILEVLRFLAIYDNPAEINNPLIDGLNLLDQQYNDLEAAYIRGKQELMRTCRTDLRGIAATFTSQAARAIIIRKLYWYTDVRTKLIATAFALEISQLWQIAGTITVDGICNKCKQAGTIVFTSRGQRDHFQKSRRGFIYSAPLCPACYSNKLQEAGNGGT